MRTCLDFRRAVIALALLTGWASSANASTFLRLGLDELSAANGTIVLGEVVDVVSYWNADGSFILTDVTLSTRDTIKGRRVAEHTVTLMGGTVDDRTALIVGGAELVRGRSYLLFLNAEDLPGVSRVLTVRDHSQGAFEITARDGELRAVSQAHRAHLVPDRRGLIEAPGGSEGLALESLISELRTLVRRQGEVLR